MGTLNKSSGKVLAVFLIIGAILLVSLTAISFFFFQMETEKRKLTEVDLKNSRVVEKKYENEIKDLKKQNFLLQEKNKEADDKINGLMDEIDLEAGLRNEVKAENLSLKEKYEAGVKAKEELSAQLKVVQQKIAGLEDQLKEQLSINKKIMDAAAESAKNSAVNINDPSVPSPTFKDEVTAGLLADKSKIVRLDDIIVSPQAKKEAEDLLKKSEGRILSVDAETEFVIINLGSKNDVDVGMMMSVYRGSEYLGDIKITRVQPEMSAADLIPPFSSRTVRKNDQVVIKKE